MWKFLALIATFGIGFFMGFRKAMDNDSSESEEKETRCVVFQLFSPEAGHVTIAGDFNGWDKESDPLFSLGEGKWGITLYLKPGRYHYKFVIDGEHWIEDPESAEKVDDGYGGVRSVISVS